MSQMEQLSTAVLDGISSADPARQFESATTINSILSQGNMAGPIQTLIQGGYVNRFVGFLGNQEFPKLQYEAASVLTNIALEKPDVVVRQHAIPNLIRLLDSPRDYVCEQAICALSSVAHSSRERDYVLNSGALKPLLSLLYENTKLSILRYATWAVYNLCCGMPPPAFDQVKPAFPALELHVQSNDEGVLEYTCLALWHLCSGSQEGFRSVIEAGFVPRLVKVLNYPSHYVIRPALAIIGTVVKNYNHQRQCVVDSGAIPILANLLTRNYDNSINMYAWTTISIITAGFGQQIQSVIDANLIPLLVNLAQVSETKIKNQTVWAISNLTSGGSHNQIKYMVEQNFIKHLCDILVCQDTITILRSLDGLENILKAGEAEKNNTGYVNCYSTLIEDAQGLEKITNLQHHENSDIYEKALKILETYWEPEEDDENTQQPPR